MEDFVKILPSVGLLRTSLLTVRPLLLLAAASATFLALPARAQVDLTGEWEVRFHEDLVERIEGPPVGDYLGLPINEAARLRAESWDASLHTLPEWQ